MTSQSIEHVGEKGELRNPTDADAQKVYQRLYGVLLQHGINFRAMYVDAEGCQPVIDYGRGGVAQASLLADVVERSRPMSDFEVGSAVWDETACRHGRIVARTGSAVRLEDAAGFEWESIDEHLLQDNPLAPEGYVAVPVTPQDVRARDMIPMGKHMHEVEGLRGEDSHRTLVLKGYGLWIMARPMTVYRDSVAYPTA
ncbi:MAG: hypothetical protein WCD21_18475 [Streptomyces sp.]